MRVRATHTGVLSFGGIRAEPQSPPTVVESPPEAVSLKFDAASGQLVQLTTGYPVDRRVGTTGGLGGLFGILEGLGYPLPTPLTRPTGVLLAPILRPFGLALPTAEDDAAKPRPTATEAERLPEERLLELTASMLAADFGTEEPSLLSDERFEFAGPVVGPLDKASFVGASRGLRIAEGLPDLQLNCRDVSICPYDVNRVWYTTAPTGTHTQTLRLGEKEHAPTGRTWISPPERGSMTFDKDGKCIAITGGYVMDRRMGNTEGLGGVYGLCVALELPTPTPKWLLRTPMQLWGEVTAGGA